MSRKPPLLTRDGAPHGPRACSACWLGEAGAAPSLETVRESLAAIADLGPMLEKQTGLADRIAKMEKDQAVFVAEVAAIADELALAASSGAILDVARAINDRVQTANAAQASRQGNNKVSDASAKDSARLPKHSRS